MINWSLFALLLTHVLFSHFLHALSPKMFSQHRIMPVDRLHSTIFFLLWFSIHSFNFPSKFFSLRNLTMTTPRHKCDEDFTTVSSREHILRDCSWTFAVSSAALAVENPTTETQFLKVAGHEMATPPRGPKAKKRSKPEQTSQCRKNSQLRELCLGTLPHRPDWRIPCANRWPVFRAW